LHAVHSIDDDVGLNNLVLSSNEVMKLNDQLVAKTKQYVQHFTGTAASGDGTDKLSVFSGCWCMYCASVHIVKIPHHCSAQYSAVLCCTDEIW